MGTIIYQSRFCRSTPYGGAGMVFGHVRGRAGELSPPWVIGYALHRLVSLFTLILTMAQL